MDRKELEDLIRQNIESYSESDMAIFLALCQICDLDICKLIASSLPESTKISTVSCNSCGENNSVLMFTVIIPEDAKSNDKDN